MPAGGAGVRRRTRLERSPSRSIVTYLVDHPTDFRGAFARMRRELRTLYFSAFQSHLWNLILARWLERSTRAEQRITVELKAGPFPFPCGLEPRASEGPPRLADPAALVAQPIARPVPSGRSSKRSWRAFT